MMRIKKNLGVTDRIIRFVLVDLLLGSSYLGIDLPQNLLLAAFILSLLLIVTIISGYSPIYHLMGCNTVESSTKVVKKKDLRSFSLEHDLPPAGRFLSFKDFQDK